MKQIIFLLLTTLAWQTVSAQNKIESTGNVGVGTTSPTTALDVRGIISTPEIAFRNADGSDDSDPYRLRKVRGAPNQNWLELQLNDDADESFRIYGNSCIGFGCGEYSQNLYHSFDASGNAYHKGNLGVGTTSPAYKLDVAGGDIRASGNLIVSSDNATGGGIKLADDGDIVDMNDGWATHRFSFGLRVTNGNASGAPVIQLATGAASHVTYFNAGNVGIGTTSPDAKLAVNGTIHSKEVKIDMNGWADHVFRPAYKLRSLDQIRAFISKNGRLPDVPSETTIKEDGLSVSQMLRLQMQKIEELTLHLIKKDKEMKALQKRMRYIEHTSNRRSK